MSPSEDDQSSDDKFSEDEEDVLQAIFDAEDEEDEGEFEGFPIQLPENMNWTQTEFEADIEDLSLQCGPKENARRQEPALGYFQLFVDNRLIEEITEFTNKNAVAKRTVNWKRTTTAEIKALLAMTIISNDLLVVPRDERYFISGGNTSVFHTPGIRNVFPSRKCYFDLKKYISFVDPDHEKTEDEARDVLYKIRNITRTITQKFFDLYNSYFTCKI